MELEYITHTTEETEALGAALARECLEEGACFVAMFGDLGVGKTAFVRGFSSVAAPGARVKSPTYTVVNQYSGGKLPVYHFDLYRIADEDELYSIGFYDYLAEGICIAEWCENIPDSLPAGCRSVTIEKIPGEDTARRLRFGTL